MAAPTFAVLGGSEQAIDDFFESLRGVVGEEGVDFFGRWREAGEIEGGAAEEGDFGGWLCGFDALGFELGGDEGIDGSAHPFRVLYYRRCLRFHTLEGPEFALALGERAGGE